MVLYPEFPKKGLMSVYKVGSSGEEVRRIQERLREAGLYHGPLDGVFGGKTEMSVEHFQGMEGLWIDGVVSPRTWKALFNEDAPGGTPTGQPLDFRGLPLTESFESDTTTTDR